MKFLKLCGFNYVFTVNKYNILTLYPFKRNNIIVKVKKQRRRKKCSVLTLMFMFINSWYVTKQRYATMPRLGNIFFLNPDRSDLRSSSSRLMNFF